MPPADSPFSDSVRNTVNPQSKEDDMMRHFPLDKLRAWQNNPRIRMDRAHIDELKASIRSCGLLQNPIATPDPEDPEGAVVIAGLSRLTALQELAEAGEIDRKMEVAVEFRDIDPSDPAALELALSENMVRRQMDAIDECIAMAELFKNGRTAEAIAATFGYKVRTVKERLALGRLIPEAQDIIRDGARDLDWARAMTLADVATQQKICNDIGLNPSAWRDGSEIRRFLTAETIPAEHALFDMSAYTGRIIHDMFDGDKLADRAEFWELQNAAIDELKTKLEGDGWAGVHVTHNPVDLWRYQKTEDKSTGHVLIEVSPNGKVTVHEGLIDTSVDHDFADLDGGGLDEDITVEEDSSALTGDTVRLTPAVAEYVAAHRSAMVQAALARNYRASLEVVVAGLIGHGEIAIRAQDYRFSGSPEARNSVAFEEVARIREDVSDALLAAGIPATNRNDAEVLAMVRSMSDEALQELFAKLVAAKVGQHSVRTLDADEGSVLNSLGRALGIDVRACWTPDEAFFDLMQTPDLRRLALALLPGDRQQGILSAKKSHLVKMLGDAFADAEANDGSMDPETVRRLNAWVPGAMRFPAEDDAARVSVESDEEIHEDAFTALFGGDGENETDRECDLSAALDGARG